MHAAACPVPVPFQYDRADAVGTAGSLADDPIEATAERVVTEGDVVTLEGDAAIAYRGRVLEAENARYDRASGEVVVDGKMSFRGDGIRLESEDARLDLDDELFSTGESRYEIDLPGRRAVGRASAMARLPDRRFALDGATYSSCPPGDESWFIRAPPRSGSIGKGASAPPAASC